MATIKNYHFVVCVCARGLARACMCLCNIYPESKTKKKLACCVKHKLY